MNTLNKILIGLVLGLLIGAPVVYGVITSEVLMNYQASTSNTATPSRVTGSAGKLGVLPDSQLCCTVKTYYDTAVTTGNTSVALTVSGGFVEVEAPSTNTDIVCFRFDITNPTCPPASSGTVTDMLLSGKSRRYAFSTGAAPTNIKYTTVSGTQTIIIRVAN